MTAADEPTHGPDDQPGDDQPGDDQAGDDQAGRQADTVPRRTLLLALALAVLFAVAAAALGVIAAASDDSGSSDVRRLAGRFTEAAFSYDYRDPEANRAAVAELASQRFQEQYEQSFEQLRGLIDELEASARAQVNDVYLAEVEGSTALAVVSFNLDLEGPAGPRTLFDIYVRISLLRLDGEWRVDDVHDITDLAGATPGGDRGGAGGPATTTPDPSPTTVP